MLEYLAMAYEIQVFPQPKAPGIAHVPPNTDGKSESKILYPVSNGTSPTSFSANGLGSLTGQKWLIENSYFLFWYSTSIIFSPTE